MSDEAAEDADHQRVVVASCCEVALDGGAVSLDAARAQELLRIRRAEAGQRDPLRPGDGLAGGIQQHARREPGADENLRRRGGGQRAEQVVVLVADSVAGVAVDDLVGGVVRVLVGHLGGINAMVGHQHTLQSIEDQQARAWCGVAPAAVPSARRSSFCEALLAAVRSCRRAPAGRSLP